ncbi:lipopolysaccharide biosynthesis protein [Maribacter aquivivus]|uniref:lipopolysaccharide biosynthesis protein n=1 Tax=Maribacter aquivivus TaxID=228958 RepID=UPI002490DF52|nr:MATE family efflux transporter [Maribacter aquivivus]
MQIKNILSKTMQLFGIKSNRTKNITKHVLLSSLYKGGHIVCSFLLVPLTINFLDTENYGVWLTLSSFIAWFSFFDIGLGNGLRNKFAEAKATNNLDFAKGYVSTAYYSIGSICVVFFLLSMLIGYWVDWTKIFNTSIEMKEQLQLLMPVVFGCFSLQLVLKLITSVYVGDQNHSINGKISFLSAALSLFIVWILTLTAHSSLLLFGIIFSALPIVILLFLNIYAFTGKYKVYTPDFAFWKKIYFKDIFGLGFSFFVIQISVLVLFSTDNFIITQLFGPEEVVAYNIAYKYVGISNMIFTILLTPYWSSITEAYAKGELDWIRKAMKNLMKFMVGILLIIIVLVLCSPWAYEIWLGDKVIIPFGLTLSMALFFAITMIYTPFNFFLNGVGKIRLHMIIFLVAAVINIPLSIFLVKATDWGINGVILATSICIFPNLILFPIQYYKLINKKATGIWDK